MALADEKQPSIKSTEQPVIRKMAMNVISSKPQLGNVLVIEDDADCSETLSTLLVSVGFGVCAVASRATALLALENNFYDVVLMDLYMPGVGAADFINHLRRHYSQTKLIVVSGADRLPELAEKLGVHIWFKKPYDFNDILEELQQKSSHDEVRHEHARQGRNQNRDVETEN